MFEFTVPEGDYDYNFNTQEYLWKDLVFTEKKKAAMLTIKEFIADSVPFTVSFVPKEKTCA